MWTWLCDLVKGFLFDLLDLFVSRVKLGILVQGKFLIGSIGAVNF